MKVLLSLPNQSWIHKSVMFAAVGILQDRRHQTTLIAPTWTPYEHSLNRIAKDFLDGDWDYWLNIDDDNPPLNNPLDLLDVSPEIMGLPTPIYHNDGTGYPLCWNAMQKVVDGYREWNPQTGLQDVDAIGSGCMIISRYVISTLEPPWFVRETDSLGRVVKGPDFHFCDLAKAAGFKVQAHYDYRCRHFGEFELIEAAEGFSRITASH